MAHSRFVWSPEDIDVTSHGEDPEEPADGDKPAPNKNKDNLRRPEPSVKKVR